VKWPGDDATRTRRDKSRLEPTKPDFTRHDARDGRGCTQPR